MKRSDDVKDEAKPVAAEEFQEGERRAWQPPPEFLWVIMVRGRESFNTFPDELAARRYADRYMDASAEIKFKRYRLDEQEQSS